MQRKRVIIDCDTGVDDAMALLLALRSPALDVLGITTVAGNATLDKVVRNTLLVVEQAERDVPVYPGAVRPLMDAWTTAENAHGSDGLGDVGFPIRRPPRRIPTPSIISSRPSWKPRSPCTSSRWRR